MRPEMNVKVNCKVSLTSKGLRGDEAAQRVKYTSGSLSGTDRTTTGRANSHATPPPGWGAGRWVCRYAGQQRKLLPLTHLVFLMWTIVFIVFMELITILLLFYALGWLFFWLQSMWDLAPQWGIEPTLPALEDQVLTTGPPGKCHQLPFH